MRPARPERTETSAPATPSARPERELRAADMAVRTAVRGVVINGSAP
ncbi:hypothetical protein [Streptomyces monomycini]